MKHPERKYELFSNLNDVNALLTNNLELRIVYLDTGETIVPKIGLYEVDTLLVAHSRLDSVLDYLEQQMGTRWMSTHNLYF